MAYGTWKSWVLEALPKPSHNLASVPIIARFHRSNRRSILKLHVISSLSLVIWPKTHHKSNHKYITKIKKRAWNRLIARSFTSSGSTPTAPAPHLCHQHIYDIFMIFIWCFHTHLSISFTVAINKNIFYTKRKCFYFDFILYLTLCGMITELLDARLN